MQVVKGDTLRALKDCPCGCMPKGTVVAVTMTGESFVGVENHTGQYCVFYPDALSDFSEYYSGGTESDAKALLEEFTKAMESCQCTSRVLFDSGCKCGFIAKERQK